MTGRRERAGAACEQVADLRDRDATSSSGLQGMLDRLYRNHAGRLLRLFSRRGDPQDAADLVQESFVLYARATAQRAVVPDCPESYLTQVAVNVQRYHRRGATRRGSLQIVAIEDAPPVAVDAEAALEARDMLNRVEAVMLLLKPMTRDIFIARRFHGYSRAEIAAQTGLSVKAVDKHLARAVEHLHRHFGDRGDAGS